MKILGARKPSVGFRLMDQTGILGIILPELQAMKGVDQRGDYHHKDVFYHTIQVIDNVADVTKTCVCASPRWCMTLPSPRPSVSWMALAGRSTVTMRLARACCRIFCRRLKLPTDLMKYAQKLIGCTCVLLRWPLRGYRFGDSAFDRTDRR